MYQLANKINWPIFDDAFKKHYSETMGKPAKPIRLMVSLLILKYVRKLSGENLVEHDLKIYTFNTLAESNIFSQTFPVFQQNW